MTTASVNPDEGKSDEEIFKDMGKLMDATRYFEDPDPDAEPIAFFFGEEKLGEESDGDGG